jgi:hypothetical protein
MAEALVKYLDADGHPVYASLDEPLPVNIGSATLSVTADGVEIKNDSGNPIPTLTGLEIPAHDYIDLSYTGANLTGVVYKDGGSGGTTVATLILDYDGNNLISVTKS